MLIECVQQAVTETPKKEQNGDQTKGEQGLPQGQLGRPSPRVIAHPQRPLLPEFAGEHDGMAWTRPVDDEDRRRALK